MAARHDLVDEALKQAQAFIDLPKEPHLVPDNPNVRAFLADDRRYDDENIRNAVATIIGEILEGKTASGDKPTITILAGPTGSKQKLLEMVADGHPELQEINEALKNSVFADYTKMKARFAELTGESIEPYEKWRPLMCGIDQTVTAEGQKLGLNLVLDKTLARSTDEEVARIFDILEAQKKVANVKLFAVALKPKEAEAAGVSATEAVLTSRDFSLIFPELSNRIPNITLVDNKKQLLFKQTEGRVERFDVGEVGNWHKECRGDLAKLKGKDRSVLMG